MCVCCAAINYSQWNMYYILTHTKPKLFEIPSKSIRFVFQNTFLLMNRQARNRQASDVNIHMFEPAHHHHHYLFYSMWMREWIYYDSMHHQCICKTFSFTAILVQFFFYNVIFVIWSELPSFSLDCLYWILMQFHWERKKMYFTMWSREIQMNYCDSIFTTCFSFFFGFISYVVIIH